MTNSGDLSEQKKNVVVINCPPGVSDGDVSDLGCLKLEDRSGDEPGKSHLGLWLHVANNLKLALNMHILRK